MGYAAEHCTTKRNPELELWRFLAAIIIMIYHSGEFLGWTGYPFSASGWFYVEFFFILSGYFITDYVRNRKKAESAWGGVFRRIKKIYPYILISAIWGCIVLVLRMPPTCKKEMVDIAERFIASILLLSSEIGLPEYVGGMWYLSVLFLVMPLFMFVVRKKELSAAVSLLVPILVYANMGAIVGIRSPFHDALRGFSAMLLGAFGYEMIPYIKCLSKRIGAMAAAVLRWGCFMLVIILMFYNASNRWLMLFCFILSIGLSIQNNPRYPAALAKVFCFCGEESVVIYLMQYSAIWTVQLLFSEKALKEQLILYYAITVIVSTGILLLKKQWDKYRRRVRQTI